MTKKQKVQNKKKKIIIIIAFLLFLLLTSSITTVTVLHITENNELGSKEGNILYYNETKKQEENNVLIVGIDEIEESEEPEATEPNETTENNQTKTANNSDKNTKAVSDAPYYIKVNYKANVVTIYKKDNSGNYTVPYKAMLCSCGDYTPPCKKYPDKIYTMPGGKNTRFVWGRMQGNVYAQYASRITPGGSILFHSVPYTAQNKSTLEWEEYDKLGTKASLGCIRLCVKDAKWIYDNCASGTQVEFYGDSNPGPLGKPTAQKISSDTEVRGWDPTDPDKSNPWPAYLKKKDEAANAQEASTKPVEDKTNETNNTNTNTNTNNNTNTNTNTNTNSSTNVNTNTTKPNENKISTNQI